ncbi:urea ABC transporter permease subunit UrtC [Longirhabdus pacifica]|uniref:urea ABC transporter permease subunit UrtC n=1 Tax=Longirhabdus pacifica TaxID=2305227 RepID=UPI001008D206|nr:urea ABC transporter permease subunit UrtC [Longirhabdus pacifica]
MLILGMMLLAPLFLSDFRLMLLAKYVSFAIVAIGLALIWGYTGILSLGHGVFFGLGAYGMAMYLKLEASGGKLPDFMVWSGQNELPWFWMPFSSFFLTLLLIVIVPMGIAYGLGFLTFRNRIQGVQFTILTQALVLIVVTLLIGQQAFTGGSNGITGFKTILGYSLSDPTVKRVLYWITIGVLALLFALAYWMTKSRFKRVLLAIRDGENRLRFIGYNPAVFKAFIFAVSAGFAGIAGALFVLHVGIISPSMMGIVPSIEMVLWVAIGGRNSLSGAVLGALLINYAKTTFSEAYPSLWLFLLGGLFVISVILLPRGFMGLMKDGMQKIKKRRKREDANENNIDFTFGESKR